jgi:hypothetical protein
MFLLFMRIYYASFNIMDCMFAFLSFFYHVLVLYEMRSLAQANTPH